MLYQQHTRLPIDIELQTHDGSEDGEDDMDSEVIIEKLLQSKEIFSAVQHTIYDAQKNQKETYIIASIFQRNYRLELKFLLRTWRIRSIEKERN